MNKRLTLFFTIAFCFTLFLSLSGCGKNSVESYSQTSLNDEETADIIQGTNKLDAWVRVDDLIEGMIIEFDQGISSRTATLIYSPPASSQFGFWTGDKKIKSFRKTGDKKYECLGLCKDHEYQEYEKYVVVEKSQDELVLRQRKGKDRQVGEWQRWIRLDRNSKHFPNYVWGKACLLEQKKEFRKATALYAQALKIAFPKTAEMYNSLAWRLAVNPRKDYRDPQRALEYATKACKMSDFTLAYMVDTLAAAHARLGNFDKAEKYQRKVIQMQFPRNPEFQERLELYIDRKPYTD